MAARFVLERDWHAVGSEVADGLFQKLQTGTFGAAVRVSMRSGCVDVSALASGLARFERVSVSGGSARPFGRAMGSLRTSVDGDGPWGVHF